jgi:hypothetical protein
LAMKPFWRRVLYAVLLIGLGFGLFVLIEHVRGRQQLTRAVAALQAKGEKLTVAELRPPLVPVGQNGADELLGAVARLGGSALIMDLPGAKIIAPGKLQPATRLRQWPGYGSSSRQTNFVTAEQLIEGLRDSQPSLDQIHAALRRPALQFNQTYSLKQGNWQHLISCKKASQWLRASSLAALFQGDNEGSLKCLESSALLAHKLAEDRHLIGQLVATAIGHTGTLATWEALQAPGWTEPQLARLQSAWAGPDFRSAMVRSLEMERAMGREYFEGQSDDDLQALFTDLQTVMFGSSAPSLSFPTNLDVAPEFLQALGQASVRAVQRGVYIPLWRVAWVDQDQARFLGEWQTQIEAMRQAAQSNTIHGIKTVVSRPSDPFGFMDEDERLSMSFYDRCRYLVSSRTFGSTRLALLKACSTQVWQRLTVAALALERYRLRRGQLPPELATLVPKFLPAVPVDPMDGRPLRYRLLPEGGFLLYSVGEDGVDNGGDPRPPEGQSSTSTFRGRDLVWPRVATPEELEAANAKSKRSRR